MDDNTVGLTFSNAAIDAHIETPRKTAGIVKRFSSLVLRWPTILFNPWRCKICGCLGASPVDYPDGATYWTCEGNPDCCCEYWEHSINIIQVVEMPLGYCEFRYDKHHIDVEISTSKTNCLVNS